MVGLYQDFNIIQFNFVYERYRNNSINNLRICAQPLASQSGCIKQAVRGPYLSTIYTITKLSDQLTIRVLIT